MLAAYAARIDADNPLNGLETGERPDPEPSADWTTVTVRATGLTVRPKVAVLATIM